RGFKGEIQPFEAKKFSITIVVVILRDFTRKLNPSIAMPVAPVPEIDDTEENDRTKFQDQLMTIGVVGRHVPGHSLTILCKLLEERTRRLYGQLQRLHSQAMNISDNSILDCLFEDIHWLVLIAGAPTLETTPVIINIGWSYISLKITRVVTITTVLASNSLKDHDNNIKYLR
ncbi:unnamed protein product, partial [Timema podura]|nr:unnamed protein product [Timema podura]